MVRYVAAIVILAFGAAVPGSAQTPPAPGTAPAAYRPGLGDLMTMTVQPRHIKLALAGREKNWAYAAYELHELQEAFERAGQVWPTWRSVPIADMVKSVTPEPMAALAKAIKERDAEHFASAYGALTAACNLCHQGANRGFVVIKQPDSSTFPDQEFAPAK